MKQSRAIASRRDFLTASLATTALAGIALAQEARPGGAVPQESPKFDRKIKVALVGAGGRGAWIANLFKQHGGYEFVAVADYDQGRADKAGAALGARKCFSGLSACQRAIESGAEAMILQTPPFFFPEHAAAAVSAGLHVYMAKPVAVDVPGTLSIGASGKLATEKKRVFLVDYQIPTEPHNLEVVKRYRDGALGKLQMIFTCGFPGGAGFSDPPFTDTIEPRLHSLIWVNDDALGCGYIGNYDIHIIDAIIWATGLRPISAFGRGGRFRKEFHGDSFDTNFITYNLPNGLTWIHESAISPTHEWLKQGSLEASIQGDQGAAHLAYWGKAYVRGGEKHYGGGKIEELYPNGAKRNIARFYDDVATGNFANDTAARSVDCTLACILGREAARRQSLLTMDELLKENRKLEVSLKGLKA